MAAINERIRHPESRAKVMTAEEAVRLFRDGMMVATETERVKDFRKLVMELLPQPDGGDPEPVPVTVRIDGCDRSVAPGERVVLSPGESICLPPRTIHQFWGEEGTRLTRLFALGYGVDEIARANVRDYFAQSLALYCRERQRLNVADPQIVKWFRTTLWQVGFWLEER